MNGRAIATVEPPILELNAYQADVMSRIVEHRVQRGGGTAREVRRFLEREMIECALFQISRAEGIL